MRSPATTAGPTTDMTITSVPELMTFLNAAFKGSDGKIKLGVRSNRLRGAVPPTEVEVIITSSVCDDGSGMLYVFEGLLNGREVKGFVNMKSTTSPANLGYINYS